MPTSATRVLGLTTTKTNNIKIDTTGGIMGGTDVNDGKTVPLTCATLKTGTTDRWILAVKDGAYVKMEEIKFTIKNTDEVWIQAIRTPPPWQ